MHDNQNNILIVAMPFAGPNIPSIQLAVLEAYLLEHNIKVQTKHMYLKAAEFYGLENYNFLIRPPIDSYTAQMIFSKYVFPKHWKQNKDISRNYFQKIVTSQYKTQKHMSFEEYVQRTDEFYNWALMNMNWQNFDIIGFTLNYGQFLPSLAIAKKIKQLNPEKKIIFGGSRVVGELGRRVLAAFDYVDFAISGEGEESLYRFSSNHQDYRSIPNLIYKENNEVKWNKSNDFIDINNLQIPSYSAFFDELNLCSLEIQQHYHYSGKLPVEISRGCWWNKCSFCNHNIQYTNYREKNVDKIIEEIDFLSDKYKVLDFQIIGNALLKKDYCLLFKKIKKLDKGFTFIAELRAGQLKCKDYKLLKEAGFDTIQTGIESFSQNYLKKMNKGTKVIDNIAALKFCKENDITNEYNLLINFPNEESIDFEETKKTIKLIKQYLDPPRICYLRVAYRSPIHCNPEQFNIEQLDFSHVDKIMFPQDFLEKGFNFVYSFKSKRPNYKFDWEDLVDKWKIERDMLINEGINSKIPVDRLIFYFVDSGRFIKIYDKRNFNNIQVFNLNETEREIFISCLDVTSFKELQDNFINIPEHMLVSILRSFEESGIIFREDDLYLSLPLCYKKVSSRSIKKEPETACFA